MFEKCPMFANSAFENSLKYKRKPNKHVFVLQYSENDRKYVQFFGGRGEVWEVKFMDNIDNKYPAMFPCAQMLLYETPIACFCFFFSLTFARFVWGYKDKILSLPKSVVKNNHFIRLWTLG